MPPSAVFKWQSQNLRPGQLAPRFIFSHQAILPLLGQREEICILRPPESDKQYPQPAQVGRRQAAGPKPCSMHTLNPLFARLASVLSVHEGLGGV